MTQEFKSLEERIRVIEDREAIKKLKAKYIYDTDLQDLDGFMSAFAEECSADYGPFGNYKTRGEIRKFFGEDVPSKFSFMFHLICNEVIEVTSETTATGDWYFFAPVTHIATNRALWLAGKYHDEFVKEKGEWKIKRMLCTLDFITGYDTGWVKEKVAKLK